MLHGIRLAALTLLVGAASVTTVQAQSAGYKPGYVLSLSGDTLRGTINYLAWDRNPTRIDFRPASGEAKSYAPADIRGFQVQNERYESATVQVDGSPYKVGYLPKSSALQLRRDEAFVRVLFGGAKSLYYYKDRDDKEHFFIRQNGALELLLYKQFMTSEESNRVVTDRSFVDQLQTYLADCPSIGKPLRTAPYTVPGMQKVFNAYYACTNSAEAAPAFQQASDVARVELGVLAGVGTTQVVTEALVNSIFSPITQGRETIHFDRSTKPAGGLFAEIILPRRLKKFSVVPELFYTAFEGRYTYSRQSSADYYANGEVQLDYRYARFNALLRYRQPLGANASLFLNGGAGMGYAFRAVSRRVEESRFYSQTSRQDAAAFGTESSNEYAVMLGLGARFKRLSGEARAEIGDGFLTGEYQSSSVRRIYLLLGYRF